MTSERLDGPTPDGNDHAEVHFLNDSGELTDKEDATAFRMIEFDGDDNPVKFSSGKLTGS